MAVVRGINQITGTIQNATYYTVQGSDKVFLRMKGGPTKHRVKTDPHYAKLRLNNSEWSGCARMTSFLRDNLTAMKPMEDYPVCGTLNAIFKRIQKTDLETEHGKRSILLSKNKTLLSGFSFSRKQALESVLKVPIEASINRETGEAYVNIPETDTRLYLYNFRKLPYFRVVVCFATLSDLIYVENEARYGLEYYPNGAPYYVVQTEWLPTAGMAPAINADFQYPDFGTALPDCVTLMIGVGIEFGLMDDNCKIQSVKYAGTAKILKVN